MEESIEEHYDMLKVAYAEECKRGDRLSVRNTELRSALRAVIIDAVPCIESEDPKQFTITAWAMEKARKALDEQK